MIKFRTKSDKVFDFFNVLFALFVLFVTFYPLYWVLIASISDPTAVNTGSVTLYPVGLSLGGYQEIFGFDKLWMGYRNTIFYVILGTAISVSLTLTGGYALSRKDLVGRNFVMGMMTITMFFGGGLIPTYLVVCGLGMENTIWAMVLPSAVSVYNTIVAKTFFQGLPHELYEAAAIDGCGNFQYFLRIAVRLSGPLVAVMVLFSAVGQWNSYMPALIYLRNQNLQPLQIVLRDILVEQQAMTNFITPNSMAERLETEKNVELIKYATIVVSTLPILVLYPFLQKYFVKGIMVGSLKG